MEVDSGEKRLVIIKGMRPAYMEEYERLEMELERLYCKFNY